MSKLKLVKLVFFADRRHLVKYGRPIVGGTYVAMPLGPVSSELLDAINATPVAGEALFVLAGDDLLLTGYPQEEAFSESEIEVLDEIDAEYGKLDAIRLADVTHELKAYRQNYPDRSQRTSRPLPYEDFFLDEGDSAMLDIIREDQEARDLLE
jgi:uncharacterized phage-associated protein